MPQFKVTSPTGKTVTITGQTLPSQQELDDIFSKVEAKSKGNWLTGNAQSIPGKIWNAAGNILNVPSYALGGVMKGRTQALQQGKISPGMFSDIRSAFQGIKEKTPVMDELPKMYGLDPNSGAGMALGFGGELLTPNIPLLGWLGKGGKVANVASDLSKTSKLTEIGKDMLLRSYKFSQSDIKKLAENLGATDPATYKDIVVGFLQKQKLTGGATQQGMEAVTQSIQPLQNKYNALVKSGKVIDPKIYARQILAQADQIKSNPLSTLDELGIAKQLQAEAKRIAGLKGPITDTMLAAKKSGSFAGVPASKISDPFLMSRQKAMGYAGIQALEEISPGSKQIGQQLKGLRTAQEVIGRTANVGKGTQIINSLKPFVPGATGAFVLSGGNPLITGAGAIAATMANNPAIQNKVARATLSFAKRTGSTRIQKALKTGLGATKKLFSTGARVSMQSKGQSSPKQQSVVPSNTQKTYNPPISPIDILSQQNEKRRKNYVPAAFPTVRRK